MLAFFVWAFVRDLALVDDNRNGVPGFVAGALAFVLPVSALPALKVLFAQGPRALRSMLRDPAKKPLVLTVAFGLAVVIISVYIVGYERGEWSTASVGAPLTTLGFFA